MKIKQCKLIEKREFFSSTPQGQGKKLKYLVSFTAAGVMEVTKKQFIELEVGCVYDITYAKMEVQ